MLRRKSILSFAIFHVAIVAAFLFFQMYRFVTRYIPLYFSSCAVHDFLHLYCPLCGGTRAVSALLHGNLPEALRYQPVVVIFVGIALVYYIMAWVHLFRKKPLMTRVPATLSIGFTVLLFGYCVVRNLLLVFFGIDSIGDLLPFWYGN